MLPESDPDFSDDCKKARASLEVESLAIIAQAGSKSWQARAWMLERLYPDRYGRRVMVGGVGGSPIQIEGDLKAGDEIRSNPEALKKLHEAVAKVIAGAASSNGSTNGKASPNGSH